MSGQMRWRPGVGLYRDGDDPGRIAARQDRASNTFHAVMTVCTLGVWGVFVWLPVALLRRIGHQRRTEAIARRISA